MSRFLWLVPPLLIISLIIHEQEMNLFSGKDSNRNLLSNSQPRRVFSSSITAYSMGFVAEIRYFL